MEEQIKAIISESADEIKLRVKEQLKQNITDTLTYNLRDEVSKIVRDAITNELKEDIKKIVIDAQPQIIEQMQTAVVAVVSEIGKQMVENATKNLSHSWNIKKIMEATFN